MGIKRVSHAYARRAMSGARSLVPMAAVTKDVKPVLRAAQPAMSKESCSDSLRSKAPADGVEVRVASSANPVREEVHLAARAVMALEGLLTAQNVPDQSE
jgi:hypothetical protein